MIVKDWGRTAGVGTILASMGERRGGAASADGR